MIKNKRNKNTVGINAGQKKIASFLWSNKSPDPKEKRFHDGPGVAAKSMVLSLLGDSDEEEAQNLPPSLGLLSVPETPENQVGPSCSLREPLQEVFPLPVSSSFCSGQRQAKRAASGIPALQCGKRGQMAPTLLTLQNSLMKSTSVKRLLHSPEEAQKGKAKRLKAASVKRPSGRNTTHVPRLDDFLDECLYVIGGSAGQAKREPCSKAKDSDIKASKPRPKSHMLMREEVPVLESMSIVSPNAANPFQVNASCCSSDYDARRTFTIISDQKVDTDLLSISHRIPCNPQTTLHSVVKLCAKEARVGKGAGDDQQGPIGNKGAVGEGGCLQDGCGETGEIGSKDDIGVMEDCWFDDDMELSKEKEKSMKQRDIPDHAILSTGLHNRYWVLGVECSGHPSFPEKHLTVTASKTAMPTELVILKDGWESTPVAVGNIVHLEGQCISGTWTIDQASGFLVLTPDLLISGTSIANSVRCMRRAVLGERFKAFDGGSRQMLNGTIVHEIFQKAAMSRDFSLEMLQHFASQALLGPQYLGEMYSLKLTEVDMQQGIQEYLPSLSDWANSYLSGSPQARSKQLTIHLPSEGRLSKQDGACSVIITDFVDIEENIWSPRFGLKGKIDLTARVRIHHRDRRPPQEKIIPLELKTGKESNSIEHRSQVILYTLMSLERRCDAEVGFLLYLKTGTVHPIVGTHMDRRELVKLRNTLAYYLGNTVMRDEGGMPHVAPLPDISNCQACKYCPQMRNCALYNRAVEQGTLGSLPAQPAFVEQETQHLREAHLQYFRHWVLLCALEGRTMESKGGRRNIWLLSAEEREQSGGCMGNLLRTGQVKPLSDNVYVHCFQRRSREKAETCLIVGDRVVVSDQQLKLMAVATGYVAEVTVAGVTCTLDRNLSKYSPETVFRLDQDEGVGGMDTHLGNLSKLMENSTISEKLRELIVDFRPPQFIDCLSSILPREAKDTVANILKGLNKPQKQAMKKVLLSKDYTLIVGMPGTGKTTTICTLVRILHACNFSVLVTSYTHSAVDNLLLKLKRFKISFLRLGRVQKVHPDILPFTEEHLRRSREIHTLTELECLYKSELVVATTCMGMKHPIFSRRHFDFCIVDEASQISQLVCLGPLFYADRFVLVGDHQQLPPIVQNPEARSLGMDESLFKRLEHHRDGVVQLTVQYRMNSKIMSLSNTLVYGGKLECGSEQTACSVLQLPMRISLEKDLELYFSQVEHSGWIKAVLESENPVCFLDTTKVPAPETVEKGGISNHTEAALVHCIVSLLVKAGCRAGDIGVIAPYRQQLKAIIGLLTTPAFSAVEVNTVDKYQGRDKGVIIVSFVRSNVDGNLGELLKDWRRLNVAITRAKHKLLMLGSIPTVQRYAPLEMLLAHLEREQMIYQLPPGAHKSLLYFNLH
ncbi:DNA replication ATP-dependent helicase/nuclease DNA2 isoform X1 [Conger conger]|uniref:DNA replication ATP-dependent helicase/nuclease DNA2 isoform X1 n=1 Tax=Conger conger TaxID=82655 RepID=UPI002A5A8E79|nr:DNA replication ATP-dependent helicase/nuclease DNA2 isoform X1 [Conger conger]